MQSRRQQFEMFEKWGGLSHKITYFTGIFAKRERKNGKNKEILTKWGGRVPRSPPRGDGPA